jgi:hypothetical protein
MRAEPRKGTGFPQSLEVNVIVVPVPGRLSIRALPPMDSMR